jgi:hypothetical protein
MIFPCFVHSTIKVQSGVCNKERKKEWLLEESEERKQILKCGYKIKTVLFHTLIG